MTKESVTRVLHVVHNMNRGGLETFIMNIYRRIDTNRVQFDFLMHDSSAGAFDSEILDRGGHLHYVIPRRQGIAENRRSLQHFFRDHPEYRIVHQHASSYSYVDPLIVAREHKVPVRILHSHSVCKWQKSKMHYILHRLNRVVYRGLPTHRFACSTPAGISMFQKDFQLIPNGIDISAFKFNPEQREQLRRSLGLNGCFVIGSVARMTPAKNQSFLLRLLSELIQVCDSARLLFVGGGELQRTLIEQADSLGISDYVYFLGVREDIPDLLSAMDTLVMPSLWEGFPVTLIEAQANGLQCVVSDVVTKEAQVTDLVSFLSLGANLNEWVREILNHRNVDRASKAQIVKTAGYDSEDIATGLQDFYQKCGIT